MSILNMIDPMPKLVMPKVLDLIAKKLLRLRHAAYKQMKTKQHADFLHKLHSLYPTAHSAIRFARDREIALRLSQVSLFVYRHT